ncbi:hypothetical protein ACFPYI_13765 [Halomarina salina]|uniref:Uncharacterized protein n=1 Tax=Halomarina salina TaxID=1872699 RepID=A0ABD5RPZ0_9EURY|nr:hypothetical protein [Halomarina salina]
MSIVSKTADFVGVDVGEFDEVEQGLMVAFLFGSIATLGIGNLDLYGYALSEQLFTVFGGGYSIGHVLGIGALGGLAARESFTSREDYRMLTTFEQLALVATASILVAGPHIPQLMDAVTQTDIHRTAALALQSAGFYAIGKSTGE